MVELYLISLSLSQWAIQTKHSRALGVATEVRKRFDLTSPLPVHPRQSLRPRLGLPSEVVDGDVLQVVPALLCGHSQLPVQVLHSLEIGHTKYELLRIDHKGWWLLEVMMAIAG